MNSNAPQKPENRPGLPQLTYRITDYPTSRKWLLSLLRDSLRPEPGNQKENPKGPLFRLTTRDSNDAAIALLDAWAVLADILTFYQERIANEGYLRTATERRSVLELARMIGYELAPGVAASTYFAFTVEDAPGSPEVVTVPKGTQVMSIPGEDELPQTFETSEEFIARVDWNNLKPRSSRPQQITSETWQLYIKGVNTRLQPGDFLLLIDNISDIKKYLLKLQAVEANARENYTVVRWTEEESYPKIDGLLQNPQLFAFRQKAFLFGHDAPQKVVVQKEGDQDPSSVDWNAIQSFLNPPSQNQIDLNSLYPLILKGTWIALYDDHNAKNFQYKVYTALDVRSITRAGVIVPIFRDTSEEGDSDEVDNLGQINLVTRIQLNDNKVGDIQSTIVLAQSEPLELVREPLIVSDRQTDIFQDPIQEKTVFLNEFVQKLHRDQFLIVSGQRIRVQLNNIGGVYCNSDSDVGVREISQGMDWSQINNGLTNTQVHSLAANSDKSTLLVGTTEGIFRFNSDEQYWEPLVGWDINSKALEIKAIQALLVVDSDHSIFVGTAEGLFCSNDDGQNWEKSDSSTGLTYTDIRVIYPYLDDQILVGTIHGGIFSSSDQSGSWKTTGLNDTDVQALTSQLIDDKTYTFAGTLRDGLFRCADTELLIWQPITDVRLGRGTVTTSGAAVMGDSGTKFRTELKQGDIIMVGEQSRTVLAITSDNKLTVDRPFRPDLTVNTPFTIETGLTTNRNMTALVAKEGFVFVGTAGSGVFCSSTEPDDAGVGTRQLGDRWTEANTGLLDLEIRCLEIDGNGDIWVGTSKAGVFRSTNNGNSWEPVAPPYSMNLDVRAILPPTGKSPNCFIGGIGILQPPEGSYPRTIQKGDILQLLERPASVSNKPEEEYRRWKLMDKDGFQGEFVTTTALEDPEFKNELTLLPALADGEWVSEVAVIQNSPTEQQRPTLTLQKPLQYIYDPATVRIYANVVPGTHGETIQEVLGSGEGHLPNQRFVLKKPPLTYVVAPNARGSASSLQVRVNRILWQEASSLYPLKPSDQNYIIRIQDDGTTIVTFGDGIKGARLPSGLENITATYRSGIGLDGNLKAEQLSILKTRPLGISEVINPLPATGGAPRESLTEAQVNAPATVRTLDRIVSIRDFEDFAQGFAGIGKAQAVPLWNGETQLVHITVAGFQGNKVLKDSSLYTNLVAAIDHARDPVQQVQIDSYERLLFNLEARFLLNPRYEAKLVTEKIRATLKTTFAFEKRKFGQDVTASEVIAAVQSVEGVIAVDLDALYQVGRSKALVRLLPALAARYDAQTDTIFPAQLLSLNLEGTQFTVVSTL